MRDSNQGQNGHTHETSGRAKSAIVAMTAGIVPIAVTAGIVSVHALVAPESDADATPATSNQTARQQSNGTHVSTSITNTATPTKSGGVSHSGVVVEVNGKKVDVPERGSYHKTVHQGGGVTHIDVSTDNGGSNSSTFTVTSNVSQSSEAVTYNEESKSTP